ncbi:uncharacterized protein CXQ87_001366 [Candidozyma duobushaemuli]|uniref:Uncharacterized protein n=2 Tax=Candidozyma TaxID=3303203 RepID=A0ABX8I188_9ASCO|nr:uncharacterized protein CXQ87_001366 [[Candida] duobushaemulonis]PVH18439.1 hypothetical protein CXQ87_001366 [[Candida] duobushaemulonis]QWU86976.1 hypothetical protein CA3LBN_001194 [[Candida] haemuloni]
MSSSEEISSGTDDDDILEAIRPGGSKTIKRLSPKPIVKKPEDDEISIPAIFLTQGAKNTSLLKKAKEISKHIEEEKEKTERQQEELERIRKEALAELNENGSALNYTYKTGHSLIQAYVQSHYANHYSLRTHRHFFFFGDCYRPKLGDVSDEKARVIETLALCLDEGLFPAYSRSLKAMGVTSMDIAVYFIDTCVDETVLEGVFRFLQQYDERSGGLDFMEGVSGTKASHELPLKMQHFNNTVRLSLLRTALLFESCDASGHSESYLLNFVLASSDFYANRRERNSLIDLIIKPVFRRVVSLDLGSQLWDILMKLQLHFFNKKPDASKQKHYELIFDFLNNLHTAFRHEKGEAIDVLYSLIRGFLKDQQTLDTKTTNDMITIEEISQVFNDSLPNSSSSDHAAQANPIYSYVYKTRICTKLLTELLYSDINKKPFLNLHIQLQTLKDRLQQDMSHWLFLSNDIPYKTDVSAALSEAYHTLDHFSTVLNKNISLIQKDIFYEDPN